MKFRKKLGRSTDGGGTCLKLFKIILTWNHRFRGTAIK